jgi:hypothetical protein
VLRYGIVAALLLAFALLAWTSMLDKSPVFDEPPHLTAGYSYWRFDDYRLNAENGNFPQRWAALPLLLLGPEFPSRDQPAWRSPEPHYLAISRQFLYEANSDPDRLLRWARGMIVLLGVALGAAVYFESRALHGSAGALVSLALFAFSPTVLAHSRLVTSDLASALAFLLAVTSLWRLFHGVRVRSLLFAAAAAGLLAVSKPSAPLLAPVALVLAAVRIAGGAPLPLRFGRRTREVRGRAAVAGVLAAVLLVQAAACGATVWAFFGFRWAAMPGAVEGRDAFSQPWDDMLSRSGAAEPLLRFAGESRLLPEAYVWGTAYVLAQSRERPSFLNGRYGLTGQWTFFPYAFLAKTTPAVLLLCAGALLPAAVATASRRRRAALGRHLYRTAPLSALIAVYGAFALASNLNIGHRHILVLYPPLFVLLGALAVRDVVKHRVLRAGVWLLVAAHTVSGVRAHPHYLAYFNAFSGGSANAYRHLVDSSLDWGQDLPGLRDWLREEGLDRLGAPPVYLDYFGSAAPEHYGIRALFFPRLHDPAWSPARPMAFTPGVYCISATSLVWPGFGRPLWIEQDEREYVAFLRELEGQAALFPRDGEVVTEERRRYWESAIARVVHLQHRRLYRHLWDREPDASVGHSILVYRVGEEQLRRALLPQRG